VQRFGVVAHVEVVEMEVNTSRAIGAGYEHPRTPYY
jgi:hypothetical protein